jgi:hypothetical protein
MKIALLCPGPSLPEFWKPAADFMDYDLIVAVNTASWLYQCDWLCCADRSIVEGLHVAPRIGYITHDAMREYLPPSAQLDPLPLRLAACVTCKYPLPPEKPTDACAFTFPNALEWSRRRLQESGHTNVCLDLFGFDCSPQALDCAGKEGSHGLPRWKWELPWIKHAWFPGIKVHSRLPLAVLAWLEDRGSWADCEAALTGFHAEADVQQ